MNAYLDLARQGKTGLWRYVLAIALMLFMWQVIGALPGAFLILWVLLDGNPLTTLSTTGQFVGVESALSFTALMLASVFFMAGIVLVMRLVHQRSFQTLISPAQRISWKRFFQGFMVWLVLLGIISLGEAMLYPGRYVLTLDLSRYIPFVFLALVLIPIQTSAEELFFRGYILQSVGMRLRNIWILSAISGFVFMVPHFLNPEAQVNYPLMGLYYFLIGSVLAYITLRDGRLELALGLHAANNLFSALIANYTVTVMPTPSLFTVNIMDVVYTVPAAVIALVVFILIFVGIPVRS
jgi:membrane protease YdiL (CAAX protease family)